MKKLILFSILSVFLCSATGHTGKEDAAEKAAELRSKGFMDRETGALEHAKKAEAKEAFNSLNAQVEAAFERYRDVITLARQAADERERRNDTRTEYAQEVDAQAEHKKWDAKIKEAHEETKRLVAQLAPAGTQREWWED